MTIEINGRAIGDGQPVFITFEAGPTHQGLESAKRLANTASTSGANAIKFQIIDPDRLCADKTIPFTYEVLIDEKSGRTRTKTEPLYDILKRRALPQSDWAELKRHCDQLGLAFFATVGFEDEVDFVSGIGCHSIKIASADIDHHPLIAYAAKKRVSIQLDTGHATIGEIEAAVDIVRRTGNEQIIIHHCPTGYPARLQGINLNVIPTLKRMFVYPIAFSDHTPGWEMDIAAVALGANLIEKTVTEDRTTPSVEHIMSLALDETTGFVTAMRSLEVALGSRRRVVEPAELTARMANRRSAHAARHMEVGHRLREEDVIYRRPGFGLRPNDVPHYLNRPLRRAVKLGERVSADDF